MCWGVRGGSLSAFTGDCWMGGGGCWIHRILLDVMPCAAYPLTCSVVSAAIPRSSPQVHNLPIMIFAHSKPGRFE